MAAVRAQTARRATKSPRIASQTLVAAVLLVGGTLEVTLAPDSPDLNGEVATKAVAKGASVDNPQHSQEMAST